MTESLRRSRRRAVPALTAAVILACVVAALATAAPAFAAKEKSCARAIIDDWFGDFRIDEIYPLHCYREAIKALPVDVRDYSSAKEDILRALAYARQGKSDPGDNGSSTGGAGSTSGGTGDGKNGGGGIGPGSGDGGGNTGGGSQATDVDTSGPSSVPLPLIVLAGLATLLLALGAAGYLTRRMAARRAGDEPRLDA